MVIKLGTFDDVRTLEADGYSVISLASDVPDYYDGLTAVGLSPTSTLLKKLAEGKLTRDAFNVMYLYSLKSEIVSVYVQSWREIVETISEVTGVAIVTHPTDAHIVALECFGDFLASAYGVDIVKF